MPDVQTLQQMTARFAPTELSADVSKLTDNERRVLAKLVEASKIVDGLFLPRCGAATTRCSPTGARQSAEGAPACTLPDQQGSGRVSIATLFVPGAPVNPPAPTTIPTAPRGEIENGSVAAGSRARPRRRLLHRHSPRRRSFTLVPRVAYQVSWRAPPDSCATRQRWREPDAESISQQAPTRSCPTTTTRATSRGWSSGAIEPTIGHAGLRGRAVPLQGRRATSRSGSGRDRQARAGRRAAGHRGSPADRSEAAHPLGARRDRASTESRRRLGNRGVDHGSACRTTSA